MPLCFAGDRKLVKNSELQIRYTFTVHLCNTWQLFFSLYMILNHGIWLVSCWKFATCKFSITCFKNYRARYYCVAPHVNKCSKLIEGEKIGGNFKVSGHFREEDVIRELILHWSLYSQRPNVYRKNNFYHSKDMTQLSHSMCHAQVTSLTCR